jgi:hypothetical protein
VNGEFKTGVPRVSQRVGGAPANLRSRQQHAAKARTHTIVGHQRLSACLTTATVRPQGAEKSGAGGMPLKNVDQRGNADQRAATGIHVNFEGDTLHCHARSGKVDEE